MTRKFLSSNCMKCIVELFGDDRNGREMIAWGRRIG